MDCMIACDEYEQSNEGDRARRDQERKAETCFTRLYGRAAYESWKVRETAITELFKVGGHPERAL